MVLKKSTKDLLIKTTTLLKSLNQVQRIKKLKKEQNLQKIRKRHALELERAENSLVESLAKFFEKQAKSAVSLFEKSQPFDPRDWDVELINHCYPALAESMGEVMFSELKQYGVSVDRVKSICRSEKASTASEWLAEAGESLIEGGLLDSSLGPIDLGFMTEYPEWMKEAIRDNLEETFSQDYWKGVNDTTSSDITEILKKGAEDGWSIERMAKEMSTKFIDDGRYPMGRGRLIARTELGHALNGARSMAMDALIEEVGPELPMRKQWLSVLGTTTRDTHANLDGVPADKEGRWTLAGVKCRWPSDVTLPAKERCNCQCSIVMAFGMDDDSASELISDYSERVAKKKSINRDLAQKASACGAGSPGAPGFSQQNTCNRHSGGKAKPQSGSSSSKKGLGVEDYAKSKVTNHQWDLIVKGGALEKLGISSDPSVGVPQILSLTGLPGGPGMSFEISSVLNGIVVRGRGGEVGSCARTLTFSSKTGPYIENDRLFLKKSGSGLGLEILARQVQAASDFGFSHLFTDAAGGPGEAMNGYYTWPRLGYDSDLLPKFAGETLKEKHAFFQKNFPAASRVSDLMKTPEGRKAWKSHGYSLLMKFDLKQDSISRKVLDEYVEAKFGSQSGSKSYKDSPEDAVVVDRNKKSINRDLIEKGSEERWSVKRGTGCGAGSPGAPGFAQQNTCNRHQGPGSGGGGGSVSQKKQPLVAAEDYSNSKAHFEVFNLKGPIAEGYQKKAKGTLSRMGFPTDEGGAREALLKLTGAPAGCSFKIYHLSNEDGFSIEFKGEGIKEAKRLVKVVHSWETGNQLIIENELFVLDDSQKGSGLGTKMLARQIEQAEKAGVVQLETIGGGTPKKYNPDSKMNGYYTWPRLGYDGDLSTGNYTKKQKDDLKKNFPKAKTVSDLMKTPEGRSWWKENGWQMELTFKISKDSVSRKVFDQYVEAKFGSASGSKSYEDSPEDEGGESGATSRIDRERRRDFGRDLEQDVVEKVFCPTGPGGGVDPTCSPGKSKPAGVLSAYTSLGVDDDGNAIPGSVGGFSGVDTSWMKPGSVDSNWALKKIHELEKLAFGGKWDVFQKKLSKPTSTNLSKYQKAILEAQNNLLSWKNGGVSDPPPGSIPVQPNQTPQISSGSNWKKVGPQMGTEKGGVYEMGGKQYYVKIPEDSSRAVTEVLASQLYDLAYGSVVKASLVEIEGKTAYATPMLDLEKADWNSKAIKEKAAEDFAIHVWLNNRDAIGAGSENPMDNIKVQKDGSLILVDAGGSLDQKGMGGGGKKSFFHKASEWDGFRDPSVNPTMSQVFGDMTPEQLIASGKKLEQASNGLIEALCKKAGRLDLAPTLIARKNDILDRVKDLESTLKKSEPVKTAAPALAMTPIPPPPVITAKSYQAALGGKLAAIQAGIDKGDIAAIEAVKVSLTSTDAYYKKVAEWKASVLAVMKANPSAKAASQEAPSTSPAKPITPFKADPDKFPPDPVFYSSDKAMVAFNQKMVKKIKGYAHSGDIQSLKDVCNEGSVEGTTIKSMKVKDWANALKNQLEEQIADYEDGLTPKAPLSETLGKILQAVPAAKSKIVEKVGKWNILGALSPSDVPVMKGTKATSHDKAVLESSGMSAYGSLTKTAQSALKSYTGSGYDDQNYSLREGNPSSSAMQTAQAIMKAGVPIKEGIVLTRYHDDSDGEFVGDSSSIKTGIVVADKGILSTSFTSAFSGRAVKWEITVGPGVRGIPVKGFSQNPSEEEVVLPPNSRLMVTKVKKEGSKALIQAIALPTEDNQCCPP